MEIFFLSIHFFVAALLIAGILIHSTKSEGLGGTIGGGSDSLFRGSSSKGFEAFVERSLYYVAWGFLVTSLISAIFLPKYF
ncbi:MAG: preprotein translocase subunit SecG [bacterium]